MTRIASHGQRYPESASAERALREKIDQSAGPDDQKVFLHRMVDEALKSGFWSYLLLNGGLNGYWTDYLVHKHYLQDGVARIYHELPIQKATQQRNQIFMRTLQGLVREGIGIASVPCGLMRDVLALDFGGCRAFTLDGYDLDEESIGRARRLAGEYGLADHARFFVADAWTVGAGNAERYDVCVSNGLNIYVPEPERVVALYRSLLDCLKPGGLLITSCLTYPPDVADKTEWDLAAVNAEALKLSRLLFGLFQPRWSSFRTTAETTGQLREAGFSDIEIRNDDARIMPTFLARK